MVEVVGVEFRLIVDRVDPLRGTPILPTRSLEGILG
jgi:hypothetical protein